MKPPRKKSNPPTGYYPFPIKLQRSESSKEDTPSSLMFEVRLTEDCHGLVSAPGDMFFLYQMGFFGKGTLSKHEPVFHDVVEQPVGFIEEHLARVSMERYSFSKHEDLRDKSICSRKVTPNTFLDVISDLRIETDCVEGEDAYDHLDNENIIRTTISHPKPSNLNLTLTVQKGLVKKTEIADVEGTISAVTQVTADSSIEQHLECEKIQRPSAVSNRDDEWENTEADEDFWSSEELPKTEFPPLALSTKTNAEKQPIFTLEATNAHFKDSDMMSSTAKIVEPYASQNNLNYQETDDDSIVESSDDDDIPLRDLELDDVKEDKSLYYKMEEDLILDPYEVLFLKMAFNCLRIKDCSDSESYLTLCDVWSRCLSTDLSFLPKYAVYHHLRAKGWIPKDGVTYGCDFMLYKQGPKYYHSSLGVLVRCCSSTNFEEIKEYNPRHLTWTKLMGINRVINNVRKELMICYVLIPDLAEERLRDPISLLKELSICETLFNRIVPSRERDRSKPELKS